MSLPAELTSRALVPTDAQAVFEVVAAAEEHELGEAAIDLEDIEGDWQRPSFDLATESIGVFEGERLVGTAEVFRGRRAEAAVHPSAHGRGIGTWLAAWTEHTARERGGTLVGQSVPDGSGGERLLKARGYRCLWNSWVLEVPADATITPQPLPEGYLLRDFTPQADDHTAYTLIEDAFGEWPDRTPSTFDDWAARAVNRPGFEPWQIRLAQDPDGHAVGIAYTILSGDCGYVDQLAVRRDQRGRGIARALLVDAFERARARGASRSELATDSRTGALPLYQHVGMVVTQNWAHWVTDV
ncbi:MAG TPA: GNAT family N-acetyltransferase [Pedococcus sp.]|jgi:GNAT superfamily N-acetyltransferase|uniref:GNAT family N-acetyltransferase n=1 Tax=Pedococcus sp. TaxID=2860345 RepID=UPI002F926996